MRLLLLLAALVAGWVLGVGGAGGGELLAVVRILALLAAVVCVHNAVVAATFTS